MSKARWTVQIAALRDNNGAEKMRDDLNKLGADLFIQKRTDEDGNGWYLVRYGRFDDKLAAQEAKKVFVDKFKRDGFVTTLIQQQAN